MRKAVLLIALLILPVLAFGQGNAFSFQGKLNDGANPANGSYDLQFKLFDAVAGGTQIGPTVLRPATTLINGVFSTTLDFGAVAFQNPGATFIEIAVKPTGSPNQLTILEPRQQLTVVPYASRSQNSTNSDNAQNSAQLGGITAGEYVTRTNGGADFIRNSTQTQANSNFNISGTGVVHGSLSVGGNLSLVGNQTVAGNSNLGTIITSGNATQALAAYGLPKAMIYVPGTAEIARCYNGITGVSTGNCGFSVTLTNLGRYQITFPFQISNRFISVTAEQTDFLVSGANVGTGYRFIGSNTLQVNTFLTDVDFNSSRVSNPFMVIVY